jgi:uncharacterized lipoprotein YddW (UPF0748 family)
MKKGFNIVVICLLSLFIHAQNAPKREFRAAWISSVLNLDFPSTKTLTPDQQRAEFISMLNKLKDMGLNAVVVQIRPNSDALYFSANEPWSEWLTGLQGRAPDPFYDPLSFMIAECRKRGLEFHAWFNPYRISSNINMAILSEKNIAIKRPEWILAYGNSRQLNPGIPDVRDYVTNVVMDVVRRFLSLSSNRRGLE